MTSLFLLILPEAGAKFKLKLKRKGKETFNRHLFALPPSAFKAWVRLHLLVIYDNRCRSSPGKSKLLFLSFVLEFYVKKKKRNHRILYSRGYLIVSNGKKSWFKERVLLRSISLLIVGLLFPSSLASRRRHTKPGGEPKTASRISLCFLIK